MSVRSAAALMVAAAGLLVAAIGCEAAAPQTPVAPAPLKIALLLDFTGSPEASAGRKRAFDLAIMHVNEGGGVLGQPVESVVADATRDPLVAVREARRLIEVAGAHAIVGPNASAAALPIAETVSGPSRHSHHQPVGYVPPAHQRRGRRLLLPHDPLRYRPGPGPRACDPGAWLRQALA